jgi:hypothetical protein
MFCSRFWFLSEHVLEVPVGESGRLEPHQRRQEHLRLIRPELVDPHQDVEVVQHGFDRHALVGPRKEGFEFRGGFFWDALQLLALDPFDEVCDAFVWEQSGVRAEDVHLVSILWFRVQGLWFRV